jgi:pimeloyl-ACP methyl ester carboxylesterase
MKTTNRINTDMTSTDILTSIADQFATAIRSPLAHSPREAGLHYEEVSFPASDGVPLEGWFMPAAGSNRLIIANHPRWFSRSGLPSHLEPWKSIGSATGNDFEVNFIPDYEILHDAGFHVLAYDLRNFGHSGAGNGGIMSCGHYEARDVIGSINYVHSRPDLQGCSIGLFSRCLGFNATAMAMAQRPDVFDGIAAIAGPQPLSARMVFEQALPAIGLGDHIDKLSELIRLRTSFTLDEMSPVAAMRAVTVPTLIYQVHDDLMTRPDDVQQMYDNIPTADKKLHWIHGSTRRWDGYLEFQKNPGLVLDWFDSHMN